jgi:hypothetical protein
MTAIQAWQHIYANVEKAESPHGQGGFQTLFHTTSALTDIEVEEIETRLVYFSSEADPIDHAFFTISTRKVVLAQTVPLSEPDRFGRKGRYLAHSLIFTPEAYAQLGVDPLQVFRHFPFATDVEEALARGNFQTGDVPAISVDIPADPMHSIEEAKLWPVAELKKLTLLALRASQMAQDGTAVALVGDPQSVENALEAALLAVPPPLYPHCTFDTYFYRCRLMSNYYWAVGLPSPPDNARFIVVDVLSRQVTSAALTHPGTTYERWAISQLEMDDLDTVAHYKGNAFAICEWLDGCVYDMSQLEEAPSKVIVSAFGANPRKVQVLLLNKLREELPLVLANRVFESIYRETGPTEHFKLLQQGFDLPRLLDILYATYEAEGFRTPKREEIRAVGEALQQVDHLMLLLLYLCWTKQREWLYQKLEHLGEDEYRDFVRIALRFRIAEPLELFVRSHGATFLDLYLRWSTWPEHDLVALVQALVAAGEEVHLPRLTDLVPELPERQLRSLEKIVNQHPDVPQSFRQAVCEAIAALPSLDVPLQQEHRGLVQSLLKTFGFSTGAKVDERRTNDAPLSPLDHHSGET